MSGGQHLRDIFYRMGLSDKDIVALSGGHTLVFLSSNFHPYMLSFVINHWMKSSNLIWCYREGRILKDLVSMALGLWNR